MTGAEARAVRRCEITGCGRRHFGRGYCRAHHARWVRHGDPQADVPIGPYERGGQSYGSVGQRLQTERGPATARRCAGCAAPAACWSYDGTDPDERTDPVKGYRYSLDLDRYQPCCQSCHRHRTLARSTPRPRTAVDGARAARLYQAGASVTGVAALLGVSRTAITTALKTHEVPLRRSGRHDKPATCISPQELP